MNDKPAAGLEFRPLAVSDITADFLTTFPRHQHIAGWWSQTDGIWHCQPADIVKDWDGAKRNFHRQTLIRILQTGGYAVGVFDGQNQLKGFAALAGDRQGSRSQYAYLDELYVASDCRGSGIGRQLFMMMADQARIRGAEAMYLSAYPAQETQSFYQKMGCRPACEIIKEHAEENPADRPLEYPL